MSSEVGQTSQLPDCSFLSPLSLSTSSPDSLPTQAVLWDMSGQGTWILVLQALVRLLSVGMGMWEYLL